VTAAVVLTLGGLGVIAVWLGFYAIEARLEERAQLQRWTHHLGKRL
jgi:hypothetical protein